MSAPASAPAQQYQFSIRDTITAIVDEYARRHKPAAGQLGLFEKPEERQKPLFSKSVDDEAGRWVTMRGARVYISNDDGRIMKGPKKLIGKTKEQIEKESAEEGGPAPKPKGLAELGRISGGRADNRQKKLFEELNPGFKFEDDDEEDFKTVEPMAMAEAPSSPAENLTRPEWDQKVRDEIRSIMGEADYENTDIDRRDGIDAIDDAFGFAHDNNRDYGDKIWALNEKWIDSMPELSAEESGAGDEEPQFTLDSTPAPSPAKPEDFGKSESTKQGALFDTGKGTGDLKGQELLFNSDAGDLNNPKTMENRAKQDDGPRDGDTNETGLTFRNGRWHRDGEEINSADIAAKARENGESIWTAAKRELGLNSMGEIPPELRKELGDAMAATSAGKAPEVKPPSPGRQRAMERQEEKQKEEEQAAVKPVEASVATPEPEPIAPVTEAEGSGDTPREQAGHYYDTQNHNEYAWARESEVSNAGKDLIGSARHKRNEWRTLEELEERGSAVAEELITRSNLMKHNPPNLAVAAERNPVTALAMHMALNSIPARPYGVKSGEIHVDTEKKKLARKLYVEAFDSLRAKAEELAMREDDPMKALSEFANHADQIRNTYKAQAGTYVSEQFNHMVTIHNRTQTSLRGGGYLDLNRPVGRRDKSTDASTQIRKFAALARENYGPDWMESEDVQEKAIDVITGSSIDRVFDIAKDKSASGKYKFNPSEAYVTGKTERKGGPSVDTSTVKKSQNVLLDSLAVSGLQYGNSMTDDERKHHTAKTAEAMVDLADALGIPDKAVGMNGKLGIAFGARGRAGAKAHYEPNLNVINLTRKTGAGSLAHEWAHFVDYNTGEDGDKQQTKSRQGNQKALKESWEAARSRIMDAVSKAYSHLGSDSRWAQVRYWTSDEEMFARFSERMVQKKLHDQGRENSYLVGLHKNSHPFWPTDSELEKSMPYLEAIYKKFGEDFEKEHGKEPKKDRYSRIREVMDSIVDQYVRPEDDVIQIPVDQYAHPLVHAAVGAGAMALANKAFSGTLRSVAHAAIGAAMAAWMQSAMAANGIQPNQAPSSPAVSVSAPATPGQIKQAGNNAVNQIVQNAINQNAAKAQAAANAPPSPAQVSAHSISAAAAGKAGVPGAGGPRPLTGVNAAPASAPAPAVSQSQSAGKEGAESGKLPVTEPAGGSGSGSFNADHPRHPAGAPGSKGGEFAPKGEVETGSSAPESSSSPAVGDSLDEVPSPRNYPDNLNKPASEQTDYSPPERSIEPTEPVESAPSFPKIDKPIHTGERQSRKAAWKKHLQGMAQQVTEKKEAAKAEKQQAKELAKATSFNPAELETPMADDFEPVGEAPKEEDFDSAKDYENAVEKHNRSKGAKQATIKKRANADLIPEIAGQYDLNHDDLQKAVDDEIQMLLPYHNRKEEARQYISKMGWNARRINQAEDRGIDSSSTKFDDVASQWAGMFPEIAGSDESEWVARMWDLSKEGAQDPPSASDEELVNRVAKRLAESGASFSPADDEGFEYADPGPVSGQPGDVDYTPFHRKAVVDLIVDRYMRLAGIA